MKKIILLLCGVAAAGLILSALAADQKSSVPASPTTDIQKLTQQVDSLQAKIKTLEERLAKLESEKPIKFLAPMPQLALPVPQSSAAPGANVDPNRPPNAWGERDFNGMKYYFMPLSVGGN